MEYRMCLYDEAYDRDDAEEIGWCVKCAIKECPKNKVDTKELLDFLRSNNPKVLKYPDGSIRIWRS